MTNDRERLFVLKERLRLYLEAEIAILNSQSYSLEGLTLTRADLSTVQTKIEALMRGIDILERRLGMRPGRSRLRYGVPVDEVRRCFV